MVETNFKHTEIGLIPHDWEVKTFADLCHNITDGSHFSPHSCALGYYMPSVKDMTDDGFDFSACKIISEKDFKDLVSAGCKPKKNDILIAKDGSILKYAFAVEEEKNIVILSSIAILRPNLDLIYPKYIAKYIKYEKFVEYALSNFKTGTGVPRIVLKGFSKLSVPIPPTLAEQERIAGALSSIDTLIGALNEQIEKKRHIKQGTMQQLLTGKKRLAGFTGEWVTEIIKDICDRYDHLRIPVAANFRIKGLTPYYGANGIQDYVDGYTHDGEFILLAEDGANNLVDYPIRYVSGKIWVNNHAHVLSAKEKKADTRFLAYVLKTIDFESNIVGSGRAKLNAETLMQLEVSIPPTIAEQSAIAAVLSGMDTEIAALEQKRDKYIAIKSGMMQDLLTGKIRLV